VAEEVDDQVDDEQQRGTVEDDARPQRPRVDLDTVVAPQRVGRPEQRQQEGDAQQHEQHGQRRLARARGGRDHAGDHRQHEEAAQRRVERAPAPHWVALM